MNNEIYDVLQSYQNDWNIFAKDVLNVNLDEEQKKMLTVIQHNRRIAIRTGHARGKDFTTACAVICFLYLTVPSKVIVTAPGDRQVKEVMMTEIRNIIANAKCELGGEVLIKKIKISDNHFLLGFAASDDSPELWTGYHSANIMVAVTEASGVSQKTFDAIEGILTGNSKLLLIYNPHRKSGEVYNALSSPEYVNIHLNCMNAPNVVAKKIIYPGQVDWTWVNEKVHKLGWTKEISKDDFNKDDFDFEWEGKFYKPSDQFLIKVMGEFPRTSEDQLIPLEWLIKSRKRWHMLDNNYNRKWYKENYKLKLGADIAGMGSDLGVLTPRYYNFVEKFIPSSKQGHMATAGKIKNIIKDGGTAYIDTIGEGAGVFSKLEEDREDVVSAKASFKADDLTDKTESREFYNMRAYMYWALRDALDPELGGTLALPPCHELDEELLDMKWDTRSNGKIIIESKADIKKRLKRSPDYADSLALTYFPEAEQPSLSFI